MYFCPSSLPIEITEDRTRSAGPAAARGYRTVLAPRVWPTPGLRGDLHGGPLGCTLAKVRALWALPRQEEVAARGQERGGDGRLPRAAFTPLPL